MSSSFVSENWTSMTNDGHFEISPLMDQSDILMSLLEEPQLEDSGDDDHERLSSVIQSLKAEIDPIVMDDDDDRVMLEEDSQSSDGQTGSEDCSRVRDDRLDFSWVDMQMMASSSPSDEMTEWFAEYYSCGDEMDSVAGFGSVGDYFDIHDQHQDHELVYDGYSNCLWQETYESVIYG